MADILKLLLPGGVENGDAMRADGHRKVAPPSAEWARGNSALLKTSATKVVPITKHHYAMAQQLTKLKGVSP
jgi:hypothetical protein